MTALRAQQPPRGHVGDRPGDQCPAGRCGRHAAEASTPKPAKDQGCPRGPDGEARRRRPPFLEELEPPGLSAAAIGCSLQPGHVVGL